MKVLLKFDVGFDISLIKLEFFHVSYSVPKSGEGPGRFYINTPGRAGRGTSLSHATWCSYCPSCHR